jgi:hypothetical protein
MNNLGLGQDGFRLQIKNEVVRFPHNIPLIRRSYRETVDEAGMRASIEEGVREVVARFFHELSVSAQRPTVEELSDMSSFYNTQPPLLEKFGKDVDEIVHRTALEEFYRLSAKRLYIHQLNTTLCGLEGHYFCEKEFAEYTIESQEYTSMTTHLYCALPHHFKRDFTLDEVRENAMKHLAEVNEERRVSKEEAAESIPDTDLTSRENAFREKIDASVYEILDETESFRGSSFGSLREKVLAKEKELIDLHVKLYNADLLESSLKSDQEYRADGISKLKSLINSFSRENILLNVDVYIVNSLKEYFRELISNEIEFKVDELPERVLENIINEYKTRYQDIFAVIDESFIESYCTGLYKELYGDEPPHKRRKIDSEEESELL